MFESFIKNELKTWFMLHSGPMDCLSAFDWAVDSKLGKNRKKLKEQFGRELSRMGYKVGGGMIRKTGV